MKIRIRGRVFGKICKIWQKLLEIPFSQYVVCDQEKNGGDINKLLMSVPDTD